MSFVTRSGSRAKSSSVCPGWGPQLSFMCDSTVLSKMFRGFCTLLQLQGQDFIHALEGAADFTVESIRMLSGKVLAFLHL